MSILVLDLYNDRLDVLRSDGVVSRLLKHLHKIHLNR